MQPRAPPRSATGNARVASAGLSLSLCASLFSLEAERQSGSEAGRSRGEAEAKQAATEPGDWRLSTGRTVARERRVTLRSEARRCSAPTRTWTVSGQGAGLPRIFVPQEGLLVKCI